MWINLRCGLRVLLTAKSPQHFSFQQEGHQGITGRDGQCNQFSAPRCPQQEIQKEMSKIRSSQALYPQMFWGTSQTIPMAVLTSVLLSQLRFSNTTFLYLGLFCIDTFLAVRYSKLVEKKKEFTKFLFGFCIFLPKAYTFGLMMGLELTCFPACPSPAGGFRHTGFIWYSLY